MSAILSLILPVLLSMGSPKVAEIETPLIPRKVLFANPDKDHPRISPDGTQLAYLAPNDHGVMNVWIKTLTKKNDRMITQNEGGGIHEFFWQNDNKHILYLQDKHGDENWHLYQVQINSERTRDLTPFEIVQARVLQTSPQHPNEIILALNHRDPHLHDGYNLNLITGNLTMIAENHIHAGQLVADHDMKIRAASIHLETGGQKIVVREEGGEWRDLIEWTPDEDWQGEILSFSSDNQSLWLLNSVGANTQRVSEIEIISKEQKVLFEHPDYDTSRVMVHPISNDLQAAIYLDHSMQWKVIDSSIQRDFQVLQSAHKGNLEIENRDLKDRLWVVSYTRDDAPSDYYIYEKKKKKLRYLFTKNEALKKFPLAKTEPISFTARDGMNIHGYLTLPLFGEGPHPTVLLIHGGPWLRDEWNFNPKVQWLSNRGYAVLQVNYRGSKGYGKAYLNASIKEWGRNMHFDVIDAKNWAIKAGHTNSKRVAIFGRSFGGYAALVGMTSNPEEFCCGISLVGPSNLLSLYQTIPPYWHIHRVVWNKMVGHFETEKHLLRDRSPLFKIHRIKKPLLIGHGANDARVNKSESDQIVKAMREQNLPVEYIVFPDEGHRLVKETNRMKFMAATESFLSEHMGGRSEPPSDEEEWRHLSTNP